MERLNGLFIVVSAGTLIVLLILVSSASPLEGQVLRGEVIEPSTRRPVAAAEVALFAMVPSDSVVARALTDTQGEFVLLGVAPGEYRLEVSALGYRTTGGQTVHMGDDPPFLEIGLEPAPVQTGGLTVSVQAQKPHLRAQGYYHRARVGLGKFIAPEQIRRISITRTSDIFRRLSGVTVFRNEPRVGRGQISLDRECRPAIYQDGMKLRGPLSDAAFNDVVVPPELIEAIEVYTGPATAPPQWQSDAACGLIVIWTRR